MATIREVRRESDAAATLVMEAGDYPYRPGQYLSIDPHQFAELAPALAERARQRGKPDGPAYFSIASDGLAPGRVEITVKVVPMAAGSPLPPFLLERARPGLEIRVGPAAGRYVYPEPMPGGIQGVVHVCAGSGAAPNRGLIRSALGRGWPLRHLLVLQDRRPQDVLYRDEWPQLEERHPDRFRLRLRLSSRGEYIEAADVSAALRGWLEPAAVLAFVCGPNYPRAASLGFIDLACRELAAAGIPAGRIHRQQ